MASIENQHEINNCTNTAPTLHQHYTTTAPTLHQNCTTNTHTHTHPDSVQVMHDDSPLSVDAYNDLLARTKIDASKILEDIAGLRATLAARKKRTAAISH